METSGGDGGGLELGRRVGGRVTAETSGGFNLGLVKIHLIKSETWRAHIHTSTYLHPRAANAQTQACSSTQTRTCVRGNAAKTTEYREFHTSANADPKRTQPTPDNFLKQTCHAIAVTTMEKQHTRWHTVYTHTLSFTHIYAYAWHTRTHKPYTTAPLLHVIVEWLREHTRPLRPLIRGY